MWRPCGETAAATSISIQYWLATRCGRWYQSYLVGAICFQRRKNLVLILKMRTAASAVLEDIKALEAKGFSFEAAEASVALDALPEEKWVQATI